MKAQRDKANFMILIDGRELSTILKALNFTTNQCPGEYQMENIRDELARFARADQQHAVDNRARFGRN